MLEILRKYILEKYGVDIVLETRQTRKVVRLRASAINVLYWYFNNLMIDLRDSMNYKCHTTVLHHIHEHKDRYIYDVEYADIYDDIKDFAFKNRPDVVGGLDHILDVINQLENV